MKILLTGLLDAFVLDILRPLKRDGHQLTLLGEWQAPADKHVDATVYTMLPGSSESIRIMEAAHFDAVLFFFSYQCESLASDTPAKGAMLDALLAMQSAAEKYEATAFVLVTDARVFGAAQEGREDEAPLPDTAAGVLIKAAEDCFQHSISNRLNRLLVRVSSLYAPGWDHSFFTQAALLTQNRTTLSLPGDAATPCDFIRAEDLSNFISLALTAELSGVAHVFYGAPLFYRDVEASLRTALPALSVSYTGQPKPYPPLQGRLASSVGWVPRHNWALELDELLRIEAPPAKTNALGRARAALKKRLGKALPYIELVFFALIAYSLTLLTGRDAVFHYLNFMLLYAVVIGNMHGMLPGLLASLVACGFYTVDWVAAGNDMYLLLYNIDNWLPFATYLVGGCVFGYLHDNRQEQMASIARDKEAQDQETQFLQTIYNQATEDRNRLQQQVLRSRDSYGRIYSITRELDSLQPEQIFLSTLQIMENVLQNHSVAIYYYKVNFGFARLVLHSSSMPKPATSMELNTVPLLRESIDQGKVFANHELLPHYPSFAAPITQNNEPIAMIVLWNVPFDQSTLYYQNLFSITCGLVQSAMLRALQYFNMSPDVYIPDTHLLSEKAFMSALSVYRDMLRHHSSHFLLMRVTAMIGLGVEEYDRRIGIATRSTDIAGRLNNGSYYVILPQADDSSIPLITARFAAQQLNCQPVAQECEVLE